MCSKAEYKSQIVALESKVTYLEGELSFADKKVRSHSAASNDLAKENAVLRSHIDELRVTVARLRAGFGD